MIAREGAIDDRRIRSYSEKPEQAGQGVYGIVTEQLVVDASPRTAEPTLELEHLRDLVDPVVRKSGNKIPWGGSDVGRKAERVEPPPRGLKPGGDHVERIPAQEDQWRLRVAPGNGRQMIDCGQRFVAIKGRSC